MKAIAHPQIYVSSSGIRVSRIGEAVRELAQAGYQYIELSGGTKPYDGWLEELQALKVQFDLSYRCHNYFPPPRENFVMNLSADGEVLQQTLAQVRWCLQVSQQLQADKLGIHAGFRMQPKVRELGVQIEQRELLATEVAQQRMFANLRALSEDARACGVQLYVENNVFSAANQQSFGGENPFLLTHAGEYHQYQQQQAFPLLLDVAHLKVSCHSLGLDFASQLHTLLAHTDYLHISDNDGLRDSNQTLREDSELYGLLCQNDLSGKTVTLEVYGSLEDINRSHAAMVSLLDGQA